MIRTRHVNKRKATLLNNCKGTYLPTRDGESIGQSRDLGFSALIVSIEDFLNGVRLDEDEYGKVGTDNGAKK